MQKILTIHEDEISGMASKISDRTDFYHRLSVRAVLSDLQGAIALMHSLKSAYYKLPGGGVDKGESLELALSRELREETGCDCEIMAQFGEVIEYRDFAKMVQRSVCYTANVRSQGIPSPTDEEIEEQFEVIWADDIESAIHLVGSARPKIEDLQIRFMIKRDVAILRAAQNAIDTKL